MNIFVIFSGFDLGNYFCQWIINYKHDKYPFFRYNFSLFPNRDSQLNLIRAYIKEFREAIQTRYPNKEAAQAYLDSLKLNEEDLLMEANYFALASSFLWFLWGIMQASQSKIKFAYLEYVLAKCDGYFQLKKQLFPNGYDV